MVFIIADSLRPVVSVYGPRRDGRLQILEKALSELPIDCANCGGFLCARQETSSEN
ncbi:hypothetical protein KIN20_025076 [Parelaphostrongylus tenuis]|uniref:Uncharacterized protein n=1 Tax=Parelaphostrongylus tenuis TaxID=148309 RepID=A0AAD5QU63_PARTN|nr:hypothetical protein KIN20_025076 [Parelaphostrongylus tenuis]